MQKIVCLKFEDKKLIFKNIKINMSMYKKSENT